MNEMFSKLCNYFGRSVWLAASLLILNRSVWCFENAKDNGDIYVVNETKLMERMATTLIVSPVPPSATTKEEVTAYPHIDFDELMQTCNASFSIPMSYLVEFNATGELPDVVDKTGMCHIRCIYEKSGLIENWKLNADKIKHYIWPATGDSIDQCEKQGKSEINGCVRTYMVARCLMLRAIVDARSKSGD